MSPEKSKMVEGEPTVAPSETKRQCLVCGVDIPEKRLKFVPHAIMCVHCQTETGDVLPIRRFDEYVGEEQVSTYFYRNSVIEAEIARTNGAAVSEGTLALLVRDNSFARAQINNAIGTYEGMAAAFEPEEEEGVHPDGTLKRHYVARDKPELAVAA